MGSARERKDVTTPDGAPMTCCYSYPAQAVRPVMVVAKVVVMIRFWASPCRTIILVNIGSNGEVWSDSE